MRRNHKNHIGSPCGLSLLFITINIFYNPIRQLYTNRKKSIKLALQFVSTKKSKPNQIFAVVCHRHPTEKAQRKQKSTAQTKTLPVARQFNTRVLMASFLVPTGFAVFAHEKFSKNFFYNFRNLLLIRLLSNYPNSK